jgi:hypothetical protein
MAWDRRAIWHVSYTGEHKTGGLKCLSDFGINHSYFSLE